jgi:hypothetical protein
MVLDCCSSQAGTTRHRPSRSRQTATLPLASGNFADVVSHGVEVGVDLLGR